MGPECTMICLPHRCEDTPVSLTPKSRYEALSSEAIQTISSKTDVFTTRSPMLFWSSSLPVVQHGTWTERETSVSSFAAS